MRLLLITLIALIIVACVELPDPDQDDTESDFEDVNDTTEPQHRTQSLHINPDFAHPSAGDACQLWYDRLMDTIPNAYLSDRPFTGEDVMTTGMRDTMSGVMTLLHAFRATGDKRLLDEADRVINLFRTTFDEFHVENDRLLWTHRGIEFPAMDHNLMVGVIAQYVRAAQLNAEYAVGSPSFGEVTYADRFSWWMDWLKGYPEVSDHEDWQSEMWPDGIPPGTYRGFERGWYEDRAPQGGGAVVRNLPYQNLFHPHVARLTYAHYMSVIVEDTDWEHTSPFDRDFYRADRDALRDMLRYDEHDGAVTLRSPAFEIDETVYYAIHGHTRTTPSSSWSYSFYSRYASRPLAMILDLSREGYHIWDEEHVPEWARAVARYFMIHPSDDIPRTGAFAGSWAGEDPLGTNAERAGTMYDGTLSFIPAAQEIDRESRSRPQTRTWSTALAYADDTVVYEGETDFARIKNQLSVVYENHDQSLVNIPAGMVAALCT